MATWVGKITLACPSGRVVRKLTGSSGDVIKRATSFSLPGCAVQKVEIVKRGIGAGARDRHEGESPFEGGRRRRRGRGMAGFAIKDLWPFGKKAPAKRHPMSHTVYMMKTKSGSYIPVDRPPTHAMAGARRRRKGRR